MKARETMIILTLCVLLFIAGISIGTYFPSIEDYKTTFTDGVVTATFNKKAGTLTFSGNGVVDRTVVWLGYSNRQFVRTIIFKNGIRGVGDCEFSGNDYFNNLERVVFEGDINHIGEAAFFRNYLLKTVEFKGEVKSISRSAFANCLVLESIDMPKGCSIGDGAFEATPIENTIARTTSTPVDKSSNTETDIPTDKSGEPSDTRLDTNMPASPYQEP